MQNPDLKHHPTSLGFALIIAIASVISVCISQRILSLTFMVPKSHYFILESKTYKH